MPADAVAYLLLVLNLLVVAFVLSLPLILVLWLLGPLRRKPAARQASHRRTASEPSGEAVSGERVLRRCDDCGVGWKGLPGRDKSTPGLKVRRWVRRRARAHKKHSPSWSKRQGWSRCPSCLSTNVRTSTRHGGDG